MTPAAWLMLVATWSVVTFFTVRFFWLVLTKPPGEPEAGEADRG